jgi:nucleoside-diphosphate-sugar epimerase
MRSGTILIFGLGYTAGRLVETLRAGDWEVAATRREADTDALAFDNERAVVDAIGKATHILSSVPPAEEGDPVLDRYGAALAEAPARWVGYLSSTGVYGDTGGAWVDESAPTGTGRRGARSEADARWRALRGDVRVFRLPGIYGPGRSPLDRLREGRARRIDLPGQVFSRIHVDDIVSGVLASFERGDPGIYNLADDLPASQSEVILYAARLLGIDPPPLQSLEEAGLAEAARGFYAENPPVAAGKAHRELGWRPCYPSYREGLRAILAA